MRESSWVDFGCREKVGVIVNEASERIDTHQGIERK